MIRKIILNPANIFPEQNFVNSSPKKHNIRYALGKLSLGFFGASQQPFSGTPCKANSSKTAAGRAIQSNLLLATSLSTRLATASK